MNYLQARKASERITSSRGFFSAFAFLLVIGMAATASGPASPDELQDYAAQCDQAVGTTVPDFDCDAGPMCPVKGPCLPAIKPRPATSRIGSTECATREAGFKSWSIARTPTSSPTAASRAAIPACMAILRSFSIAGRTERLASIKRSATHRHRTETCRAGVRPPTRPQCRSRRLQTA
jgi:hypothetical protein